MDNKEDVEKNILVANKNMIFDELVKLGVATVVVSWNGGGDSGGVENITAKDKNGKAIDLKDVKLTYISRQSKYVDPPKVKGKKALPARYEVSYVSGERTIDSALEDFCMDWVDSKGSSGWYNNDGGYGEAIFTVQGRVINIDHSNYTQTADSIGAEEL